jgi:predicted glycosyltransferase
MMNKKILVAPLDWGLGHATRCVPVIRALQKKNQDVLLCASGGGKIILQKQFPELKFIDIPGFRIKYPRNGNLAWAMAKQTGALLRAVKQEHHILSTKIKGHHITHIISDNRYGLYAADAKCAIITHQTNIQTTGVLNMVKPLLGLLTRNFIHRFNECWIPDTDKKINLSGILSSTKNISIPVKHIGNLSRFTSPSSAPTKKYDIIAMISGPEPQKDTFEQVVVNELIKTKKKCLVITGKPEMNITQYDKQNLRVVNHIEDSEFTNILHPDTLFIARSGYSTLMDLVALNHTKALLVPTPGQTEQEYLAAYINKHFSIQTTTQKQFSICSDVEHGCWPVSDFSPDNPETVLENFIASDN